MPIHEESSIAASYAFNGEQLTERRPALVTVPEFLANSVQMDPPFGTQEEKKKLIEAVVSKEVLKSQMPIVFITTLEGLMQQLIPGYHYDSKAPSDAIRDITIVRSLPNGARGSATGGGLILAQSMNEYPQWAALEMFHEKLHIFLMDNRTARVTHDESQEIVVTALQYLIANKLGLSTKRFEEIFYWNGVQGLITILQTLKDAKILIGIRRMGDSHCIG